MARVMPTWLRRLGKTVLILVAVAAVGSLLFRGVVRPWYWTWGATKAEVAMALPGDGLFPDTTGAATRAVTIDAPPEKVWPWLVQVGYKRAGWYNLDWVNNMFGAADFVDGHRSSTRIVPELQDLKVGDFIRIHPQGGFNVAAMEPYRSLILMNKMDLATGNALGPDAPPDRKYMGETLAIILRPMEGGRTRLVVRDTIASNGKPGAFWSLLEPGVFIQESRFMLGVKSRAEALARK